MIGLRGSDWPVVMLTTGGRAVDTGRCNGDCGGVGQGGEQGRTQDFGKVVGGGGSA